MVFLAGSADGTFDVGAVKIGNPGKFGWKGITPSDPTEQTKNLRAELPNDRMTMVAVVGMFTQDGLTASVWAIGRSTRPRRCVTSRTSSARRTLSASGAPPGSRRMATRSLSSADPVLN